MTGKKREYFSGREWHGNSKRDIMSDKATQQAWEKAEDESVNERVRRNIDEHGA
jgi:hypothetical protein